MIKKVLLSFIGAIALFALSLCLTKNITIELVCALFGFIITFVFAEKEIKAIKIYNNNFALTLLRLLLASSFIIVAFGSKTILQSIFGFLFIIAILPITYRFIKKQFNFKVPNWVQVCLPIIITIVYSFMLGA